MLFWEGSKKGKELWNNERRETRDEIKGYNTFKRYRGRNK